MMSRVQRFAVLFTLAAATGMALPHPAQAWWRGGAGFGFYPFAPLPYAYYPPPPVYYAPPPVYYAPPPAYAPPAYAPAGPAQSCYAGQYVCPLEQLVPRGTYCSCPSNNAGRVTGQSG